jgi:uncharacterized protein YciI
MMDGAAGPGKERMIVVTVEVTCAEDYLARREPHRRAHIERLLALRAAGTLVAGGPAPDGRRADLYYRLPALEALRPVVEEDPYFRAGAWTAYAPRRFETFVDPWEAPPVVLDGSRPASIVEGPTADPELAQLALVELRGRGRLAFGGVLSGGDTHAVLATASSEDARHWLEETGSWAADRLSARPWLYVL